jgi:CRISPR type III-B/RAMP module RAMP protein Cmr1
MTIRLRQPQEAEPPSLTTRNRPAIWRSYEFEMITPMLGGGVDKLKVDLEQPIRATSIKGRLRYWWRMQRLGSLGDKADAKVLFAEESRIWGEMNRSDDEGDSSDCQSQVSLRVVMESSNLNCAKIYKDHKRYVMFTDLANAELLDAGTTFRLYVKCRDQTVFQEHVLPALEWWYAFGGVGGRTRRGLGALTSVEAFKGCDVLNYPQPKELTDRGYKVLYSSNPYPSVSKAWLKIDEMWKNYRSKIKITDDTRFAGPLVLKPHKVGPNSYGVLVLFMPNEHLLGFAAKLGTPKPPAAGGVIAWNPPDVGEHNVASVYACFENFFINEAKAK